MEASQLLLIGLEVTTLAVFGVIALALHRALGVWRFVRGRVGGALAGVIVGVLFACLLAQGLAVVVILGAATGFIESLDFRRGLYLVQQLFILAIAIWASWRLKKLG